MLQMSPRGGASVPHIVSPYGGALVWFCLNFNTNPHQCPKVGEWEFILTGALYTAKQNGELERVCTEIVQTFAYQEPC